MQKHIYKIVLENMCMNWKIENDLTPESLLAYLLQWCARRLFLCHFVRERVLGCAPTSMQKRFRELKSYYCCCKRILI